MVLFFNLIESINLEIPTAKTIKATNEILIIQRTPLAPGKI